MDSRKVLMALGLILFSFGVVSAAVSEISEATFNDFPTTEVTKDAFLNSLPLFSYCLNNYECASSYCGAELDSVIENMPSYCTDFCESEGMEKGYNPCGDGVCYSLDSTVGYCVECMENSDCDNGEVCSNLECVEDGSSGETIKILTCSDLQDMNDNLGASYVLKRDIDCSKTKNWNDGKGFDPIGNNVTPFTGSFDGNGYTISNLYINRSDEDYVGLFGYGDGNANVEDVSLKNSIIVGHDYVGAIMGYNNLGYIESYLLECNVSGGRYVGGILGYGRLGSNNPYGKVKGFASKISVSGSYEVGGLVGFGGIEKESYVISSIIAGEIITGGLVGYTESLVDEGYFSGIVSSNKHAGGLVGWTTRSIINSYTSGKISGVEYVGGLAGIQTGYEGISDSYSSAEVTGRSASGGLVGQDVSGYLNNSFFVGYGLFREGYYNLSLIGNKDNTNYYNLYFLNSLEYSAQSCLMFSLTTDENCVAISNISYFYDSSNAPMSNWDFENTWVEVQRGLPIFKWQAEDKDCLNDNMCRGDKKCYNFECVNVADIGEGDSDSNKDDGNKKNNAMIDNNNDNSDKDTKKTSSSEIDSLEEDGSIQLSNSNNRVSFFVKTKEWVIEVIESIKSLF